MIIINLARSSGMSVSHFYFFTLAGIEEVRLEEGERWIAGRWKEQLTEFFRPKKERLIESFANWRAGPLAISAFTLSYGPLHEIPKPGGAFRFLGEVFKADQRHFRWLWEHLKDYPDWEVPTEQGHLAYRGGRLVFKTSCLYDFLYLDLVTCSSERLRKCRRPDCEAPYFVTPHLKKQYCSDLCAQWAQRKWKRDWWRKNGKKRRAARQG